MTELAVAGSDSASLTRDSSPLRREFSPPSEALAAETETASINRAISGTRASKVRREYTIRVNSCYSLKVPGDGHRHPTNPTRSKAVFTKDKNIGCLQDGRYQAMPALSQSVSPR